MLLTDEGCCGVGGASQDSAGFGAMEEGLISKEGRNIRDFVYTGSMLSHVQSLVAPWTIARQTPLPIEILQARILEWFAVPSSRGSSQPRD